MYDPKGLINQPFRTRRHYLYHAPFYSNLKVPINAATDFKDQLEYPVLIYPLSSNTSYAL
jgi:hypothetical protein